MNDIKPWAEKYRPQKIDDCILPESLKTKFKDFVVAGDFPNLILSGGPGMGKTTVAKALCSELDYEPYLINASLEADKDKLRNEITHFVTTVSLYGNKKCVILDEADYLSPVHVQPGLRTFMEQHSSNARFIMTCNYKNKIMDAILSRSSVVDFKVGKGDKLKLMAAFTNRIMDILKLENIKFDPKVIVEVVNKFYPDNRRILNELEGSSKSGKIDIGILAAITNVEIEALIKALKEKDFKTVRKWVVENSDIDSATVFRKIYNGMYEFVAPQSIPELVVLIDEYQYKMAFVADPEITMVAFMVQIMGNIEFK